VPYCPVRPGQFGYYGTQWRRWPGSGVVPASAIDAATPVAPPRLEVPGPDEESPRVEAGDGDPETDERRPAEDADAPEPAVRLPSQAEPLPLDPQPVEPEPTTAPQPSEPRPLSEPDVFSAPPAIEPVTPDSAGSEPAAGAPAEVNRGGENPPAPIPGANPFDEASARGWRKFLIPVSGSVPSAPEPLTATAEPLLKPVVPMVRFDHLDEVRAAESARGRKISVATPK
jgi:hypothetical protein